MKLHILASFALLSAAGVVSAKGHYNGLRNRFNEESETEKEDYWKHHGGHHDWHKHNHDWGKPKPGRDAARISQETSQDAATNESSNSCESGMFAERISYGRRGREVTFAHSANNALCTDRDHNPYQFGELHGVRTYNDCATACVNASNQEGTLHELRGVDYDCRTYKCHCLHDAADKFVGLGPYRAQGGVNNQGTGPVKNSMWANRWTCGTITSDNNYEFAAAEDRNL